MTRKNGLARVTLALAALCALAAFMVLAGCSDEQTTTDTPGTQANTGSTTPSSTDTADAEGTEEEGTDEEHADEHGDEVHWSYEGETGPEHWGDLKPEWETAKTGTAQSPINIETDETVPAEDLGDLELSYEVSSAEIVNNGHTIQVNVEPGSTFTVDGQTYELKQFHFHTLSEHTIDGEYSPMEVHLVHLTDEGEIAVIGVMMEEGEAHPLIADVWANAPETEDTVETDLEVNATDLLPEGTAYYRYTGSLTTPPCTEGVVWTMMKDPIYVSAEQVQTFEDIIGENYRPVQPLNDREVKEY
jgi:carbonic anhydrase